VEWADRVLDHLPPDHLRVEITATGETTREFTFHGTGPISQAIVARLAQRADRGA
jgi:tRNA A37 threonylcarbamoyladenosine biosynthesis protein TsaE